MLERTVFNGKNAAAVMEDRRRLRISGIVACRGKLDRTVTGHGQLTVVVEELVANRSSLVIGSCDLLTVHIKRDCLVSSNGEGLTNYLKVSKKNDLIAVLCSIDSFLEVGVLNVANLCNGNNNLNSTLGLETFGCIVDGESFALGNNDGTLEVDARKINLISVDSYLRGCSVVILKCNNCIGVVKRTLGCYLTISKVVIGAGILCNGSLDTFCRICYCYNIVSVIVYVNFPVIYACGRADSELIGVKAGAVQIGKLLKGTAYNKCIRAGINGYLKAAVEGSTVEDELSTVRIYGTVKLATVEPELRAVGSVASAVIYNVSSGKHTAVESDNRTILYAGLSGGFHNRLAGSSNAAGIGCISLDIQCITCRASAVIHNLDSVLIRCGRHSVRAKVKNMMLSRAELNHIRQSHVSKQGQRLTVRPVCYSLVDSRILGRTHLSHDLAYRRDDLLCF